MHSLLFCPKAAKCSVLPTLRGSFFSQDLVCTFGITYWKDFNGFLTPIVTCESSISQTCCHIYSHIHTFALMLRRNSGEMFSVSTASLSPAFLLSVLRTWTHILTCTHGYIWSGKPTRTYCIAQGTLLCGSLDGKGVWGRMDTSVCMAESLCCPPETNNIVNQLATPQYKIKSKKKKKKRTWTHNSWCYNLWLREDSLHKRKVSLWFMFILMKGESESEVTQSCWLFATAWTIAHQAPLSMEFSRREYWNGLPFPSPRFLPNPRIEPGFPTL